jgi:hypothetical protein
MSRLYEDSQPVVSRDEEVRSSGVTNAPERELPTGCVSRRTTLQRFVATVMVSGLGNALTSKWRCHKPLLSTSRGKWWLAILGRPRSTAY